MVCIDVMTTTGAVLIGLALQAQLASAVTFGPGCEEGYCPTNVLCTTWCAQNGAVCPIDTGLCTGLGGSGSGRTTGSALPTSSSTTSSCIAETEACLADSECLGCAQSVNNAGTACLSSDFDSETATCSESLENACCLFEEIPECLDDNLLVAWLDCAAAEEGCDVTITDCADGGTAALNTASATPSAIVGGTAAVLSAAAVLLACMDVRIV